MKTTMMLDLPDDLVHEILSRVPLNSMRALRLTCKKWNTLSKSGRFTKMHLGRLAAEAEEGTSRFITLMDNKLCLTSVIVNENPSTKSLGQLTCLKEQVKVSKVFHCEGLLLIILEEYYSNIVVWNPYWGQTRWIKSKKPYHGEFVYALGYVNNNNNEKKSFHSHKILRFGTDRYFLYEIYDFDSELWTKIDFTKGGHISDPFSAISLKGNTYWCAVRYDEEDKIKDDHIICFDFTEERFGPLMHLPFLREDDCMTLSSVGEEKLVVFVFRQEQVSDPYKIDIWITTKIEAEEITWSKFLTLDMEPDYVMSNYNWNFFLDEGKKVVMEFDNYGRFESAPNKDHWRGWILKTIGFRRMWMQIFLEETLFVLLCSKFSANQET